MYEGFLLLVIITVVILIWFLFRVVGIATEVYQTNRRRSMSERFVIFRNEPYGISKQIAIEKYHMWLEGNGVDTEKEKEKIQKDLHQLSWICVLVTYATTIATEAEIKQLRLKHHVSFVSSVVVTKEVEDVVTV